MVSSIVEIFFMWLLSYTFFKKYLEIVKKMFFLVLFALHCLREREREKQKQTQGKKIPQIKDQIQYFGRRD